MLVLSPYGEEGASVLDYYLPPHKNEICLLILGLADLLCLALHTCFCCFWVLFCLVCSILWTLAKKETRGFSWLNEPVLPGSVVQLNFSPPGLEYLPMCPWLEL